MAGTLNDEYKLFAILSVLFVITSILNYERGASVILVISLSTTLTDVVWRRSLKRWSIYVYYGI